MLPNSKILQFLHSPPPALPPLPQVPNNIPTSPSPPILKQHCKFSRRDFTICSNSSLLLLLGSTLVESRARAEEGSAVDADKTDGLQENAPPNCTAKAPTKRAFLDISIDGEPAGRIVIGLYGDDAPAGAARFSGLVSGAAGISYRRKEFVKIMPNYVQHGGVRSYGVDAELAKRTGSNLAAESLVTEWEKMNEKCPGTKNLAGSVGIVVRDPTKPPPKIKLVARGGKLEIDEEDVGADPNGTEFVITSKDSPELDTSTLVIGRVLEGMEVVKKIGLVKTVQENTGSPYFRVAKLIGDKRATVAERGFNRPYSKKGIACLWKYICLKYLSILPKLAKSGCLRTSFGHSKFNNSAYSALGRSMSGLHSFF